MEAWGIMAVGERRGEGRSYRHLIRLQYARRDEEQDHVPLKVQPEKGLYALPGFSAHRHSMQANQKQEELGRTAISVRLSGATKRTSGSAT